MVAVEFGYNVLLSGIAPDAQHPFPIESCGNSPAACPCVLQAELNDFDWCILDGEESQPLFEPVAVVLKNRITGTMPDQVRSWRPAWHRSRRPHFRSLFVAQVDGLPGRISDWIV